jgi:hypothetical protein
MADILLHQIKKLIASAEASEKALLMIEMQFIKLLKEVETLEGDQKEEMLTNIENNLQIKIQDLHNKIYR